MDSSVQNLNTPTSPEEALLWAQARKKDTETVTVAQCPCCSNWIAIYIEQSARQETVPGTILANQVLVPATDDKFRS